MDIGPPRMLTTAARQQVTIRWTTRQAHRRLRLSHYGILRVGRCVLDGVHDEEYADDVDRASEQASEGVECEDVWCNMGSIWTSRSGETSESVAVSQSTPEDAAKMKRSNSNFSKNTVRSGKPTGQSTG